MSQHFDLLDVAFAQTCLLLFAGCLVGMWIEHRRRPRKRPNRRRTVIEIGFRACKPQEPR